MNQLDAADLKYLNQTEQYTQRLETKDEII